MKKLIFALIFFSSSIVNAGHPHQHRPHHHYHNNSQWIAPFVLGGVLGAVIVNQWQQPPVVSTLPPPPYGYRYIQIFDQYCNCYRWAITPNY